MKQLLTILGAAAALVASGAFAQEKPGKIRTEMAKAEKAYIDLYNRLNTKPEFAFVCRMDKPTGSSLAVRVCQPRYVLNVKEKSATEVMQAAVAAGDSPGSPNVRGPNVGAVVVGGVEAGQPDMDEAFRQNLLAVQAGSPELRALRKQHDELQARHDAAVKAQKGR
jgi:hypothetical protein